MTTRTEFLAGFRIRVDDQEGSRWDDDEVIAYLTDAIRDYSKYFPRKREQELVTDGESARYDVPEDLIDDQVLQVLAINPATTHQEAIPHRQLRRRLSNRYYEVIDKELIFGWTPDGNFTMIIRYNALHTMPASGNSTVPFEDEDLIYTYAMAEAWQRQGGNDAALSRWTEDQKRDDSPLIPHYARLWARYQQLVDQKLGTPRFYKRVRTKGTWRE